MNKDTERKTERDLYTEISEEKSKHLKAEVVLSKIKTMEGKFIPAHELRNKALVAFLYLSAARIEEVTDYILEPHRNKAGELVVEERTFEGNPLKKSDTEDLIISFSINNVRCLKRTKSGKEKGKLKRSIPILDWGVDKEFLKIVREYLKTLEEDDYLFPFTRQRSNQILEKIKMHPHQLRHIRLTHLTRRYGFKPNELLEYVGWTSIEPSATYVHLDTTDLLKKMMDKAREIDKIEEERGF